MDQVRQRVLLAQEAEHVVREGVQMVPELFFRQVLGGTRLDAHDAGAAAELLDRYGVVRADARVVHQAREEVDSGDVVACRERPRELHDVKGLAAGVRVAAQLQIRASDEAVDADQRDVDGALCGLHGRSGCESRTARIILTRVE
jgi:hypothetical protein